MREETIICVVCPRGCTIDVRGDEHQLVEMKGYECPRGREYAEDEFVNPLRVLPTTVLVKHGELPLVPVKTEHPIPRDRILDAMREIARVEIEAPVDAGDVLLDDLLGTGVALVATRSVPRRGEDSASL